MNGNMKVFIIVCLCLIGYLMYKSGYLGQSQSITSKFRDRTVDKGRNSFPIIDSQDGNTDEYEYSNDDMQNYLSNHYSQYETAG